MEPHGHHRRSRVMPRDVHAHHKRIEVVTDVVFVTASPSGGGKVVGFSTLGEAVAKTPSPTTVAPKVTERPQATSETPRTTQSTLSSTSESTPEASSTSTFATSTSAVASTSESVLASTSATLSASETSIVPTASSTGEPASGGMSTGTTIGLAVAGVAIFLVLGSVLAFVYRKRSRKKIQEAYGKPEDEKAGGAAVGPVYMNSNNNLSRTNTITSEKAPRVPSLRPVTQFLPNLTVTPPAAEPTTQLQPQAQIQPQPQPQQQAPVVAASPVRLTRSESRKAPPPALVFTKIEEEVPSAPVSGVTTANSAAPPLTKTQTSPTASPSSAEYTDGGDSVGTPVTGGPAGAANTSPVHRVQMDFKPSMEDELGLRVGQLVRLLYEYDDGWALCIRLDRSQQGVCPRTCLSQRPVKPRPQGPPPQGPPGARGPPHPGFPPNGRPQSPAGSRGPPRPYSPTGGPRAQSPGPNGSQFPRPQSPAQMRPQSPAQMPPQSPAQSPAGYVKQTYRPATPTQQAQLRIIPAGPVQRPQSPVTQSPVVQSPLGLSSPLSLQVGPPLITVTTTTPAVAPEAAPSTPTSPGPKPQSPPGSPPRPAVAPVRPSPLSNEQTSDHESEHAQPVFHAM
ncbi:hypothetical protein L873DRAFT_1793991 [Choiromyces venosus 120613-1]|uniref:SH3 domain-containing protein n=1 Tax=Choiromyces venosus 120613-1 TaxID=1336337 RepID=A0A3N4J3B8_9PEZI|nr:hypothetical protein L873DRAFT_1793991 [Choiromyces venosus 120613-1]